jgi:hypothetical protein
VGDFCTLKETVRDYLNRTETSGLRQLVPILWEEIRASAMRWGNQEDPAIVHVLKWFEDPKPIHDQAEMDCLVEDPSCHFGRDPQCLCTAVLEVLRLEHGGISDRYRESDIRDATSNCVQVVTLCCFNLGDEETEDLLDRLTTEINALP